MTLDNPVPSGDITQKTFENSANAVRIIQVDGYTQAIAYTADGMAEYIGIALPGTAKDAEGWQIKKLTYSGTNVTDIQFADGDTKLNKIWDNRATSYTYS